MFPGEWDWMTGGMQPPAENDFLGSLMQGFGGNTGPGQVNPLLHMGAAILSASGQPGATTASAIGRGALVGMQSYRREQLAQTQQARFAAQVEQAARERQAAEQAKARFQGLKASAMANPNLSEEQRMAVANLGPDQTDTLLEWMAPEPTEAIQTLEAFAQRPDLYALELGRRRAGASTQTVQFPNPDPLTPVYTEQYKQTVERAAQGANLQSQADTALLLLNNIETGKAEELLMPIKQLGASFGMDFEGLSGQEAFQGLNNAMIASLERTPGPQSDLDVTALKSQLASLGDTKEANLVRLYVIRNNGRRAQARAQLEHQQLIENGKIDYNEVLQQLDRDYPVMPVINPSGDEAADEARVRDMVARGALVKGQPVLRNGQIRVFAGLPQ